MPAATENAGVATVPVMVYAADATAESAQVALVANAFTVWVVLTDNADAYTELAVVGVEPSVV